MDKRIAFYRQIVAKKYHITAPHEAKIPKDDGSFRIVYVNDDLDRIFLSIVNDLLFETCKDMIHKNCVSYQTGIGCGKIVKRLAEQIPAIKNETIGVKIDLSKYFDSVPVSYIDKVFDQIEQRVGTSVILDITREYYHNNHVLDLDKNMIEKYSSLKQGCAVASFLADSVLYDIDQTISSMNVIYVRYSDDILILGNDWEIGYDTLKTMLNERSLTINPKKVEILTHNKWFKFLGFNLKDNKITLSASRIKSFQKEIEKRTIHSHTNDLDTIEKRVNRYLYYGTGDYSWATSVLPVINCEPDIHTLNLFVMDAIRAAAIGKKNIGGIGSRTNDPEKTIFRGKGKNVKRNMQIIPNLTHYMSLKCMQNAMRTNMNAYTTLVRSII